ncbi:MAG TPA: transposase [Solirubrobacteraceae bacterium]
MRVTTAFKRMLGFAGASIKDVAFGADGVVVTVALHARKRPVCSECGARGLAIKEHREKRWRHLDLGACRCHIECRLRRLYCPGCGDVYEQVPWARAGSPYTRDFEDTVAFLAQQMAKTPLTKLMRIGWRSVGKILARVVADKLDRGRLDGLVMIGCDEVSYASEHRFLTGVADHDTGGVVWAAPGRNAATLQAFFDELTDEQKASIQAVSIDMSAGYEKAIRAAVPNAAVAFDPLLVQGSRVKRRIQGLSGSNCDPVGGACARLMVRVLCARAPSLTSVHDPRVGSGAGDMMCDGVIPLGEALRPLGLSGPSTRAWRAGACREPAAAIGVTKGLARTGKVMRVPVPPRRARAACGSCA